MWSCRRVFGAQRSSNGGGASEVVGHSKRCWCTGLERWVTQQRGKWGRRGKNQRGEEWINKLSRDLVGDTGRAEITGLGRNSSRQTLGDGVVEVLVESKTVWLWWWWWDKARQGAWRGGVVRKPINRSLSLGRGVLRCQMTCSRNTSDWLRRRDRASWAVRGPGCGDAWGMMDGTAAV